MVNIPTISFPFWPKNKMGVLVLDILTQHKLKRSIKSVFL